MVKTVEIIVVLKLLYFQDKEFKEYFRENCNAVTFIRARPLRTVFLPPAYC